MASTSYLFFTCWLWSFTCFFGKNSAYSQRQIRHKTDFLWPVFSRIRQNHESLLIRENAGRRKLVIWNILCSNFLHIYFLVEKQPPFKPYLKPPAPIKQGLRALFLLLRSCNSNWKFSDFRDLNLIKIPQKQCPKVFIKIALLIIDIKPTGKYLHRILRRYIPQTWVWLQKW